MTSHQKHQHLYLDGRVDHPMAARVRAEIKRKKLLVGEAFCLGNVQLATRYKEDLSDYFDRHWKYLQPTWPAVPIRTRL